MVRIRNSSGDGPLATDDVAITAAGSYTVTIAGDNSTQTAQSVVLGTGSTHPTLRLSSGGSDGAAGLSVSGGFTNHGTLALTDDAAAGSSEYADVLTVTGGTLTNAADGTVAVDGTAAAGLDPDTISLESGATFVNQGAVAVTAPAGVDVNGPFTDAAGGSVAVPAGVTATFGGAFVAGGGTLAGGGTVDLTGQTVTLDAALDDGPVALVVADATVNGPAALTNLAGKTLTLRATTVNAPLVNQGTLAVPGTNSTSAINGGLTAAAGSTVSLASGGSDGAAGLSVSGGFTNHGTLALTDDAAAGSSEYADVLTVTGGTLTNAADGTVAVDGTAAAGLDPDTISLESGATFVNQGAVAVTAPAGVDVNGPFTDAAGGSVAVPAGVTATFGGAFVAGGGTLGNGGTIVLSDGLTATLGGSPVEVDGTLSVGGTLTLSPAAGVTLSAGDTYSVLTYASLVGTFASVDTSALTGLTVTETAGATAYDVLVTAGSLTATRILSIAQQPTTAVSGVMFAPAIIVDVVDATGAVITDDASDVTLAIASGPAGATLGGTATLTAVGGVTFFNDLYLTTARSSVPPSVAAVRPDATTDPSASTTTPVTAAGPAKLVTTVPVRSNDRSGLPAAVYRWTRKLLDGAAADPVAVSPPTTTWPLASTATDVAASYSPPTLSVSTPLVPKRLSNVPVARYRASATSTVPPTVADPAATTSPLACTAKPLTASSPPATSVRTRPPPNAASVAPAAVKAATAKSLFPFPAASDRPPR